MYAHIISFYWALLFFYLDTFSQRIISLSYIFYDYIFHATHCILLLICFWLAFVIGLKRTKANCDQSNDLSSRRTLPCVPPTSAVLWKFRISLLSNLQQHTGWTPTREWVISSGGHKRGLQKLNPNETCLTDYKTSGWWQLMRWAAGRLIQRLQVQIPTGRFIIWRMNLMHSIKNHNKIIIIKIKYCKLCLKCKYYTVKHYY